MTTIPESFIVGKGRLWLVIGRPDLTGIKPSYSWRQYAFDAKKFDNAHNARKKAREVGGIVYRFDALTGKKEPVRHKIPQGAICDLCREYTAFDGVCHHPESEYYGVNVSYLDVCEDWRAKDDG